MLLRDFWLKDVSCEEEQGVILCQVLSGAWFVSVQGKERFMSQQSLVSLSLLLYMYICTSAACTYNSIHQMSIMCLLEIGNCCIKKTHHNKILS